MKNIISIFALLITISAGSKNFLLERDQDVPANGQNVNGVFIKSIDKCTNKSVEFPADFALGNQSFLENFVFASKLHFARLFDIDIREANDMCAEFALIEKTQKDVPAELIMCKNPGTTKNKNIISQLIDENFNVEEVSQLYYEVYLHKKFQSEEGFSIIVSEFISEKARANNTASLKSNYNADIQYLIIDNYLIQINSEDEKLRSAVTKYYQNKLSAKLL